MTATRIFRIFVSSTFSDMIEERNTLYKSVFPKIHQLCREQGVEFQPIDLRWGISDEAGYNQQTMKICLSEIKRCQDVTRCPNVIVLLGNRYGWQPLPYTIGADEFTSILERLDTGRRKLLVQWYKFDKNAVPPVYVLRSREGKYTSAKAWRSIEADLRAALQTACLHLPSDQQLKYTASATAQEIEQGVFSATDPSKSAFCFFRTITDFLDHVHDPDIHNYVDMDRNGDIDPTAQEKLNHLKQRLRDFVPNNVHEYTMRWEHRQDYLSRLCDDVETFLRGSILEELNLNPPEANPLHQESAMHMNFARQRARHFVGRQQVIEQVREYLRHPLNRPLILFGESGVGKTTLMSNLVGQIQAIYPHSEFIYRFIGVTPQSSDVRALLEGLCREIAERYQTSVPIPTDYRELTTTLEALLSTASPDKPLVILLDALDQISTLNNAHDLDWLPRNLPDYVSILCSTMPGDMLERLRAAGDTLSFAEVGQMTVEEGSKLLQMWLTEDRRTLQPEQQAALITPFMTNGSPLYLRLAYEEARLWHSYTPPVSLSPSVAGIIRDNLFRRLEGASYHGRILVSHALAYLVAARDGLSEDELLDVLTHDDAVWSELVATSKRHKHHIPARQLPAVIWSRLYYDLQSYLSEYAGDGALLLGFYHRQLREVAAQTYLTADFHHRLAGYFARQPLYSAAQIPNRRRLAELPYQYFQGDQHDELCQLLTGTPEWMEAQFTAVDSDMPYIQDIDMAISAFTGTPSPEEVVLLFAYWTARQVVNVRVSAYTDDNLKYLVYLGNNERAINMARLRKSPESRITGLLTIYEAQSERSAADSRLLYEAIAILRSAHLIGSYSVIAFSGVFHRIISTLCETGNYDVALALSDEEALGIRHSPLPQILTSMFHAGLWDEALEALSKMTVEARHAQTIIEIVHHLREIERPIPASVWEKLLAIARQLDNPAELYRALQEIASIVSPDDPVDGEAILEEAAAALAIPTDEDHNNRFYDFEDLVAMFINLGKLPRALELAREIHDRDKCTSALCKIAVSLAEQGDERAEAVFDEAISSTRTVKTNRSFGPFSDPLVPVVESMVQAGLIHRALEVAEEITQETGRISIFCAAAVAFADNDAPKVTQVFAAALDYTSQLDSAWSRVSALCEISTSMAATGDARMENTLLEACTLWHLATDKQEPEQGFRINHKIVSHLITAKYFDHALRCAKRLDAREKAENLIDIFVALHQAGDPLAGTVLSQALDTARALQNDEDSYRNTQLLEGMVSTLEKVGLHAQALTVNNEIPIGTRWLSGRVRILTVLGELGDERFERLVTDTFIAALDINTHWDISSSQETALALLNRAGRPVLETIYSHFYNRTQRNEPSVQSEYAAPVLDVIAKALVQLGSFESALNIARCFDNPRKRITTLSHIARALTGAGNPALADTVFAEALRESRTIDDARLHAYNLETVIADLIESGSSLAETAFQEVLTAREQVEGSRIAGEALSAFAVALAQAHEFEQAFYVVSEIQGEDADISTSRSIAFSGVATALATAGRFEDSLVAGWQCGSLTHQREALTATMNTLVDQQPRNTPQILDDALQMTQDINHKEERVSSLCAVAVGMARLGDSRACTVFEQAIAGIAVIDYEFQKYRTLRLLTSELVRCYRPEFQPVVDLLIDTARAVDTQEIKPYSISDASSGLSYVAVLAVKIGDSRAESLFDEALERGRNIPDEKLQTVILEIIAANLAAAGLFSNALSVIQEIADDEKRQSALYAVVQAQAESGLTGEALVTTLGIPDTWQKADALNCIAAALVPTDPLEARKLLSEAFAIVRRRNFAMDESIRSLLNIARTMLRLAHPDVSAVLQDALDVAQMVDLSNEQTRDDVIPMAKYYVLRDMAEAGFFMDILTADLRIDEFYSPLKFFLFVCEIVPKLPGQFAGVQSSILTNALRIIGWKNKRCWSLHETLSGGTAVSLKTLNPLAYAQMMFAYGRLYSQRGDFKMALETLNQAIQFAQGHETEYGYFWGWRGDANRRIENFREAIADFDILLQQKDSSSYWFWARGSAHYALGNYDLALKDMNQSLAIQPDDPWTWWWRGHVYFAASDFDKAHEDYMHAIQLQPDEPQLYRQRIRLRLLLNDNDGALKDVNDLLRLSADGTPDEDRAFGLYWRAIVYIGHQQWDEALNDLEQCIRLNQDIALEIAFCHLWRGLVWLCQDNPAIAEQAWEMSNTTVTASDPRHEVAQLRILLALMRQEHNQIREAFAALLEGGIKSHEVTRFLAYLHIIEQVHPHHTAIRTEYEWIRAGSLDL